MTETIIYIVGFNGYKSRVAAEAARDAENADQLPADFFAEPPPEPTTIEEARIVEMLPGKDKWGRTSYRLDNGMIAVGLPDRPFESYIGSLCAPETMYCGADYYIGPAPPPCTIGGGNKIAKSRSAAGWQVYREIRAQMTALWIGIAIITVAFGIEISDAIGHHHRIDEWGMAALAIWGFFEAASLPSDIACIREAIYKD